MQPVINEAISYIFDHLDEDITVDDVARHCSYSKYHLTRMFKEDTDEALYQFIKRVRLERSAWRLKVEKEKSITEIGEGYGYSSSNFATAFKKHLNVSPADFRKQSEKLVEESSFANGISIDDIEKSEKHISQGIEKLLNGIIPKIKNDEYTIVFLAEPISDILAATVTGIAFFAQFPKILKKK